MMTTEDRISAIARFASARNEKAQKEAEDRIERIEKLRGRIRALAPRIGTLLDVAEACYQNSVQLGPLSGDYPKFVTDGISHGVGFFVRGNAHRYCGTPQKCEPFAVGIMGGGCDGEDFMVSREGEIEKGLRKPNIERVMGEFLAKFDNFEDGFFSYIDNISEDCAK